MPVTKDHYINLKNGIFDSTSKAALNHLFDTFATDPNRTTMVVHFHGGGVSQKAGMDIANDLYPVYRSAGGYPVFFVWESGFLNVISHNLTEISQERIFQTLLQKVVQFAVARLTQTAGARAAGHLELPFESEVTRELGKLRTGQEPYAHLANVTPPVDEGLSSSEEQQFLEALEADRDIEEEAGRIANSFRSAREVAADRQATRGTLVRGSTRTLMSPEVIEEVEREQVATGQTRGLITTAFIIRHCIAILKRVIMRIARGRDHGLHPTIVEELLRELYLANVGETIWRQMKQDTADAFKDDPQLYGGTAFLEGLKALWVGGQRPRIVLIGHSTGAVYICHLLRHAHRRLPPGGKFDVVFLAPACDFKLLSSTLDACGDRVGSFRLFAMRDAVEKTDRMLPVIYPRSLLYFVSGVVEDEADKPLVGMQRFYSAATYLGAYPEIGRVQAFLEEKPGRAVWSEEASGPGRMSRAAKHSAFDDEADTIGSLKHIISHGF